MPQIGSTTGTYLSLMKTMEEEDFYLDQGYTRSRSYCPNGCGANILPEELLKVIHGFLKEAGFTESSQRCYDYGMDHACRLHHHLICSKLRAAGPPDLNLIFQKLVEKREHYSWYNVRELEKLREHLEESARSRSMKIRTLYQGKLPPDLWKSHLLEILRKGTRTYAYVDLIVSLPLHLRRKVGEEELNVLRVVDLIEDEESTLRWTRNEIERLEERIAKLKACPDC